MGMQLTIQTHLRARKTAIPLLTRAPELNPPAKLPRSAATNGIQVNVAICLRLNPRVSLKYSGSQKT